MEKKSIPSLIWINRGSFTQFDGSISRAPKISMDHQKAEYQSTKKIV